MNNERSSAAPMMLMCYLVLMCIVVALLFFVSEPNGGHGMPHSRFTNTMDQGNTGSDRLTDVRWLGLAFAVLQVAFFVTCLTLGVRKRTAILVWFSAGGLLYAAMFVALILVERSYAEGGARDIVLGLPLPTAIMIYGVGGVPILFSVVYVLQFDRWVLKPEDLQRVTELAEQRRLAQTESSD